jgi:type IV pilus assembly protein PilM
MLDTLTQIFNKILKKEETTKVVIDLGGGYIKAIYKDENNNCKFLAEKNKGEPIRIIGEWLEKERLSYKPVKLAVKGQDTLIRYTPFPKVDKKNLKEVFGYEISKFMPFNKDDVYFDVSVLDENYSSHEIFVLLAVVKKSFLDSLIKDFQAAKINLKAITLNNLALINLFMNSFFADSTAAVLDIGFNSTLFNMFKKGMPCLSREIKVSAGEFLQRIAKIKNIDVAAAENMIIQADEKSSVGEISEIIEVIEEMVLELSEEVKNSLDYFEVNWGSRIQSLYVTGGLSKLPGIDKIMNNSLGVEVKIWNPLEGSNFNPDETMLKFKEMLGVSLGMAV